MRTFKTSFLFLAIVAVTAAFTPRFEGSSTVIFMAKAATAQDIFVQMDSPQSGAAEIKLDNVVVTDRQIRFSIKNHTFKLQWVGSHDVAMTFNDLAITPVDLKNPDKLKKKLFKYLGGHKLQANTSHAGSHIARVLLGLMIPSAHAQNINLNVGQQQAGLPFNEFANLFTVENFNKIFGAMFQMIMSFQQWQMSPTNPYGFHQSQSDLISIPKVPTFQ